jgi:hypothetical protein
MVTKLKFFVIKRSYNVNTGTPLFPNRPQPWRLSRSELKHHTFMQLKFFFSPKERTDFYNTSPQCDNVMALRRDKKPASLSAIIIFATWFPCHSPAT